ncbi:transcriptional regulator [Xenophilus aerolatus]|nr:transcriptional regulator [Xenophilus aerolatus]
MDRLAAMETFVVVVECGSFSAAARRLEVGQPAVSKSVAQLEARLGVRLLLRSAKGLLPTEAGQSFYGFARRAIEEANQADDAARGNSTALKGRLRVCAGVTLSRIHIIPRIKPFLDRHPDLSIDVVLDDRVIDLLSEGIDVALRTGTLADSNMTARKLAQGRRSVVATPAYLAAHGTPRTPAELANHQAVVYDPGGGGSTWSFREGSTEISVVVSGRMRVTAAEGLRAAVCAHMGLAVASDWMFAPEIASGEVVRVLTDWALPELDLWAVFPTGRMASAKARAFADFVQATLA